MRLMKQNVSVKCDMPRCRNMAEYVITADGVSVWSKINICKECTNSLQAEIAKIEIPQSPENYIKRARNIQDKMIAEKM